MTQVIGSWDCAVGGQGQTIAGWKQETRRSTSCVSQAFVSRLTISAIWASAAVTEVSGVWCRTPATCHLPLALQGFSVGPALRHLLVHRIQRIRGSRQEPAPGIVSGSALHLHHRDRLT